MSINTVIFDLDGTLLYTLEDLTDSVNYMLDKNGFALRSIEEVKDFVGNGVPLLIKRVLPEGVSDLIFNKCLEEFKNHYSENMYNKSKPYDGIIVLLEKLKTNGYKIGVVSNKFDSAVKKLCNKYFNGLVDIAIGQRENIKPKPSPDSVIELINKLNSTPDECIFVGDSEVDIETAINAGIPCLSVTWGYKNIDFLYEHGASTLIYSPEDIWEMV